VRPTFGCVFACACHLGMAVGSLMMRCGEAAIGPSISAQAEPQRSICSFLLRLGTTDAAFAVWASNRKTRFTLQSDGVAGL
jgi:hypothetical protein